MQKRYFYLITATFLLLIQFDSHCQYICRDLGYDDTNEIQTAINFNNHVIIPKTSTLWRTAPLQMRDGVTLQLEEGVILEAISGGYGDPNVETTHSVIKIIDNNNVTLEGLGTGANIRMLIENYNSGQQRHCIRIQGSENIIVNNITLSKSGGDGIYIGASNTDFDSENVNVTNVTCDANARQGLSIISARNINIRQCVFKRTGQLNHHNLAPSGPWAGIDIEPNNSNEILQNILIEDCDFENNVNFGILIHLVSLTNSSSGLSITISDINIEGSFSGLRLSNLSADRLDGFIDINNVTVEKSKEIGMEFINWINGRVSVSINNSNRGR